MTGHYSSPRRQLTILSLGALLLVFLFITSCRVPGLDATLRIDVNPQLTGSGVVYNNVEFGLNVRLLCEGTDCASL